MEQELEKAKRGLEEQAKRWSTSKYKEKREQVMRSWKEDKRSRGDTMKKQEGAGFQEGNRKKKRKKYKHTFMEKDWLSGEQGATEQLEQGANICSSQESELPPYPQAREQEVPRKEMKQATITMFMPEAPPEAPPPPSPSELQNDEGGTVRTGRDEHYRIDDTR